MQIAYCNLGIDVIYLTGFMAGRSNISKNLKQSLLRLWSSMPVAKKEREEFEKWLTAASNSLQTDAFFFADDSIMAQETTEYVISNGFKISKCTMRASGDRTPSHAWLRSFLEN